MSYLGTDYYDCNKNDELMLDPRLAEYVKKRQYYKEHDLETKFLQKNAKKLAKNLTRFSQ